MPKFLGGWCLGALCATFAVATPPVTGGLVLRLESDSGVTAGSDGSVTRWSDQSSGGNDLFGHGRPLLKNAATPSGARAIALDGRGARLERVHLQNRLVGLPAGNADRSVFLVARYHAAQAWGGFSYGAGEPNSTYGLSVKPGSGELLLQGWGGANDHVSNTRGLGSGWLLQSGIHHSGTSTLFRDGAEVLRARHSFGTILERISLGEEIAGLGNVRMDVAAVLVYNRALSAAERASVDGYLRQKYLSASASNSAPNITILSPAHKGTSTAGTELTFTAKATDAEDGDISRSIIWTSDRHGELGRGAQFKTRYLSNGTHVITAAVTDSRKASDQARVTYTMVPNDTSTPTPAPKPPVPAPKPEPTPAPTPAPAPAPAPNPGQTIKLFNGRDLSGLYVWDPRHGRRDPDRIFTVKDGLLRVAGSAPYAALLSEKEYGNYIMTLEFKWGSATYGDRTGKARDAGIMLHSKGRDGGWRGRLMANIEVQVMEGGMGDLMLLKGEGAMRMTVPCRQVKCESRTWYCRGDHRWDSSAARRTFSSDLDTVHSLRWDPAWKDVKGFRGRNTLDKPVGEWNRFVVIADGGRLEVYFNGVKVNEAFNVYPTQGRLQLESEQAEYYVRRWDIELLD